MRTFREGCFRTQYPGPENAHKRAEGQQEGLTSGLTYSPRRPVLAGTDVPLKKKTPGTEGHGSMSVVLWCVSMSSV